MLRLILLIIMAGTLRIILSGTKTPFSVSLSPNNAGPFEFQTTGYKIVPLIPAGTYTVTVTDDIGCQATLNSYQVVDETHDITGEEFAPQYTGDFNPNLAMYRNYEADNHLCIANYTGRVRNIQTAITAVEYGSSPNPWVILDNVPSVSRFVSEPNDFGLHNATLNQYPDNNLVRVESAEVLGTYSGHSNCVKFTTNSQISPSVGDKFAIFDTYPTGVWRNTSKTMPLNTGSWNQLYTVTCWHIWKNSSNEYCALVAGYNSGVSVSTPRIRHHLFKASSLTGTWTDQNTGTENVFSSSNCTLPAGTYAGVGAVLGVVKGKRQGADVFVAACQIIDGTDGHSVAGILVFNSDLTYREAFRLNEDYSYNIGPELWIGLGYHNGKFLYTLQDGTYNSGKRIVLQCSTANGTFTYHSTIFDFSSSDMNSNDGRMYSGSLPNGFPVSIGGKLYFITAGDNRDNQLTGDYRNHANQIWKYNDGNGTWSYLKGPILCSPHSSSLFGFNWGWDHTGVLCGFYLDGNTLYAGHGLNAGTDTYECTIVSFDLLNLGLATTTTTTTSTTTTTTTTL